MPIVVCRPETSSEKVGPALATGCRLEVQWGDTLDRMKSMMGRLYKERQRTERAYEHEEEQREQHTPDAGEGMSNRAQQVQAQILARRNRNVRPS